MLKRSLNVEKIQTDNPASDGVVLSYIASTTSEDRYGDIISQNWSLEGYKNNPVVLLNHNSSELPIGRGDVSVVDDQLLIDITFDMSDPKAAEVARKASDGFMNAVSVGFNPLSMISRTDLPEDHYAHGERGVYYDKAELLEVSMVTIPANGDAVAAKSLQELSLFKALISSEVERLLKIERHIAEVQELEDKVIVTYLKEEAGPVEEAYMPDEDEEEEDKKEKTIPELDLFQREFIKKLLSIGENHE
tara:strand:+ start:1128 stop:1871 length:744 start_codon:yes stop_codon:yes gene_type:complete